MSGTPLLRLSSTEFHPQWDRNPPTDGWDRISSCGAQFRTRRPRPLLPVRSSNPSGSHSSLNSPFMSKPKGGRTTQMNGRRVASRPAARAIICGAETLF
ncbi:unnamed protein product [Spirodela intermedia]|uniref:Uncharacterized protein n=1 Tax=Spirodela intermedia TaxID=51605 RepID=A0A7I8KPU1_SPIIN|nr:unnamed protein product [Spirodela intermedia]